MKPSFLLLLLLPLGSFAQSRTYMGPTMQQNQQSRDYFNRSMNQRTQDFQMRQLQKNRSMPGGQPMTAEALDPAKQQLAEQQANDKLTRLAQEQQRKREANPAKNPQQAAAQLQEDAKRLNLLAVSNYREVFLPWQISSALQARSLSPKAQRTMDNLTGNLLKDAWWAKQEGAQLPEKIKTYGDSLTTLTVGLLGYDLASPPPTPEQLSRSRIDDLLAKGTFDQNTATHIIQEVAMAEKLIAGKGLAEAVLNFKQLTSAAPAQTAPTDPKKLRKEVMASLRQVNTEMQRYDARIASLRRLSNARSILAESTSTYLGKNGY